MRRVSHKRSCLFLVWDYLAEAAQHHPDILNSNGVPSNFSLVTHDANGISEKDFALAETKSTICLRLNSFSRLSRRAENANQDFTNKKCPSRMRRALR